MKKTQADNINQQMDDLPKEKINHRLSTKKPNANNPAQHKAEKHIAKDEKENNQRAPEISDRKEKKKGGSSTSKNKQQKAKESGRCKS